ncbi:uncharacterized protein LOC111026067 [Momordica charantia]|uniref:Uncharacterized protein LOC111026067 n=1 Tax=Momordica charantia TaxID=3673 RepID=A0A6J1DZN2_MOMCH|nr:uncharacterized protein LOC111026067 [Momordica charantia]
MSMNCLTCQALPRTQSDRENNNNNYYAYETSSSRGRGKSCCLHVTRRWSAELTPTSYGHIKTTADNAREGCSSRKSFSDKKVKDRYLRSGSMNEKENEPRLVRSSGMRRDWSFEDLRLRDQKKGRFH